MFSGRKGAIATMLALVVGCGGDDPAVPDGGPDTDGGGAADAGGPDATPGACFGDLVDLAEEGQVTGNSIFYIGTVRGGDGELEPLSGCTSGTTRNEKVHSVTTTERSRVRATTYGENTQNLDTVVYIRTECLEQDSELACDDNGAGAQSIVTAPDVPAGTTVYIVVDSAEVQEVPLPQQYEITVEVDPVLLAGDPCDPADSACEAGTVCSSASGSPVCATPLGGPTLTGAILGITQNGAGLGFHITGSDPDGDVVALYMTFLDGGGSAIDITGDGVPDNRFNFAGYLTTQIAGELSIDVLGQVGGFFGGGAASVLVELADSEGTLSNAIEAPIFDPTWVGLGDACDGGDTDCWGELTCESLECAQPASGAATCAAADALTPVTAAGTYTVNIPAGGPDTLEGSCFYSRGLAEAVMLIENTATDYVRVTARSDASPSATELDTYLYIRTSCVDAATEIGCNDDIGDGDYRSVVSAVLEPGQTGYLVVDGSYEGSGFVASGTVGVSVELTTLLDAGAACVAGDECIPGYVCYDLAGGTNTTCTEETTVFAAECAAGDALVGGMTYTGSLPATGTSFWEASCRYSGPLPDDFHTLTLATKADVTLSTDGAGTEVDTVLAILDACAPTAVELGCNDDIDASLPNWRSSLTVTLEAGTYTVLVDQSSLSAPDGSGTSPDPAAYSLAVTTLPVLGAGAVCDPTEALNRCDDGLTCTGTPSTCQ